MVCDYISKLTTHHSKINPSLIPDTCRGSDTACEGALASEESAVLPIHGLPKNDVRSEELIGCNRLLRQWYCLRLFERSELQPQLRSDSVGD